MTVISAPRQDALAAGMRRPAVAGVMSGALRRPAGDVGCGAADLRRRAGTCAADAKEAAQAAARKYQRCPSYLVGCGLVHPYARSHLVTASDHAGPGWAVRPGAPQACP